MLKNSKKAENYTHKPAADVYHSYVYKIVGWNLRY